MIRIFFLALLAIGANVYGRALDDNFCTKVGFFALVDNTPEFYGCYINSVGGLSVQYWQCPNEQVFNSIEGYCVAINANVHSLRDTDTTEDSPIEQPTLPTTSGDIENPTIPTEEPTTESNFNESTVEDPGSTTDPTDITNTDETTNGVGSTEEGSDSTTEAANVTDTDETTDGVGTTEEGSGSTTDSTEVTATDETTDGAGTTDQTTDGVGSTEEGSGSTTDSTEVTVTDETTDGSGTTEEEPASTSDPTDITDTDKTTDGVGTTEEGSDSTTEAANVTDTDETTDGVGTTEEGSGSTTDVTDITDTDQTTDVVSTTEEGSDSTTEETTTAAPFNCPVDGFFPQTKNCSEFIYCSEDKVTKELTPYVMSCPAGMHYNAEGKFCDAKTLCDARNFAQDIERDLECFIEGSFANTDDCSKYYSCSWDVQYQKYIYTAMQCPKHKVFHTATGQCGRESIFTCIGRTGGSIFGGRL